ncbi:lactoylglutathione lyase [Nitzschia inconspicua]|uniref:lactoylglutathione lyase n=1 Tax=Nitzschia inconspicua TaxID=303405 RepID=A0A9K3KUS8_9STRA|nr:lactoylglutathione lyase [Nitzschia inconspicua]
MRRVSTSALAAIFGLLFTNASSFTTAFSSHHLRSSQRRVFQSTSTRFNMSSSSAAANTQDQQKQYQPDVSQFMTGDRPAETKDYVMQQTMLRVKDPLKSLHFYCSVLGFKLVMYSEFPQWGFNVYFVAPVDSVHIPQGDDETAKAARWKYCMNLPGCIELTYNYGTEQEDGQVYNTGNADSTGTTNGEKVKGGFGHIGITVPDVYEACERFQQMGVEFHKTPNSGGMKGLAFLKDPDGYLVEVLPQGPMIQKPVDCAGIEANNGGEGYKDNSK